MEKGEIRSANKLIVDEDIIPALEKFGFKLDPSTADADSVIFFKLKGGVKNGNPESLQSAIDLIKERFPVEDLELIETKIQTIIDSMLPTEESAEASSG